MLSGRRPWRASQLLIRALPNLSGSESASRPGRPEEVARLRPGKRLMPGVAGIFSGATSMPVAINSGVYSNAASSLFSSHSTAPISMPQSLTMALVLLIGIVLGPGQVRVSGLFRPGGSDARRCFRFPVFAALCAGDGERAFRFVGDGAIKRFQVAEFTQQAQQLGCLGNVAVLDLADGGARQQGAVGQRLLAEACADPAGFQAPAQLGEELLVSVQVLQFHGGRAHGASRGRIAPLSP